MSRLLTLLLLYQSGFEVERFISLDKIIEDRVGRIESTKGSKSERIEMAIEGKLGDFTKNEIRTVCPHVGEATINRVFEKLKVQGKIEAVGKGRNSK